MIHLTTKILSSDENKPLISHYPPTLKTDDIESIKISTCEKILADWFGSEVILFASGKSALSVYLLSKHFNRYKHKIQVPQFFPAPLLNVFTKYVFPVHIPNEASGICLYHQYGFPQRCKPKAHIIFEDIAHSFFASPYTGMREWVGEVAVFSLSKFFSLGGHAGGLIVHNSVLADEIHEIVRSSLPPPPGLRDWMRTILADAYNVYRNTSKYNNIFVSSVYELLQVFFSPDPKSLSRFPTDLNAITKIGEQRLEIVQFFRDSFRKSTFNDDFWNDSEILLPFALPFFGNGDVMRLNRANQALDEFGVVAGIYNVDVNRNMYSPNYKPCLLIPCHQEILIKDFEDICDLVHKSQSYKTIVG